MGIAVEATARWWHGGNIQCPTGALRRPVGHSGGVGMAFPKAWQVLVGVGRSPDLQPSFPGDSKVPGGEEANSGVLNKEVDSALEHTWVMVSLMKGCLD